MPELYILPFDHRGSFMKIVKAQTPPTDADVDKARSYKKIIYEAFRKAVSGGVPRDKAGILVDEWLGKPILLDARKRGFITCTPLEKSGQDEFDFDREDWKQQLAELQPTYAKVLVRYNPDGDRKMNARQAERLAGLSEYLKSQSPKFLFELLVPATDAQMEKAGNDNGRYEKELRPGLTVTALKELTSAGVDPDVWKLEGVDSDESMSMVSAQVKGASPEAGIIILGRGESAKKAEAWLKIGAKAENAIGFAVGRTVFKEALEDYDAGKISREDAVGRIASNYSFFVSVWEKVKGS